MIAIDWGTSSFRACLLGPDGAVRERLASARGIMAVPDRQFAASLREAIGPWLARGETRVLMAGMIGSRQGWQEAPYLPCPAGAAELARALVALAFDWAELRLVPGLATRDDAGIAEVMRGEETQIAGAVARGEVPASGLVCLPGTHAKWARLDCDGRILGFATHMTGEVFAALRGHTILGRMMREAPHDPPAFAAGLARAGQPGGLLHHLFGVRAEALAGRIGEEAGASYLSGILIGHEVRAALAEAGTAEVLLIGEAALAARYAEAIAALGGRTRLAAPDAAAAGLFAIGRAG
ncbi:MAG: 2-dehydro-3-deoxygalactonokinase [Rhodospirillales bacterium]|nr:2-dehydro-3-deoxygalactonokinase [Rhodospirillales bacterium]